MRVVTVLFWMDSAVGPQLRRGQGVPKRSVWTRPKMQALFWIVRRKVVRRIRVSGLSIAACHSPRARMEMRGSGPNRLLELESSPFGPGFPDPVSMTVCPYIVLRPAHIPPGAIRAPARLGDRRRFPVDFLVRHQRPGDARHPIGQRHCNQHTRLARQHPGQP